MVCDKIAEVAAILDGKTVKEFLLPYYLKFTSDQEPEVPLTTLHLTHPAPLSGHGLGPGSVELPPRLGFPPSRLR